MAGLSVPRVGFCIFLVLLGLLALSTSIAAEFKRIKASQVIYEHGECTLPSSPSVTLGLTAAMILIVAQFCSIGMGGCICCCNRYSRMIPKTVRSVAILSLFFSWICFLFALILLVGASSMNQRQPYKQQWLDNHCYVVKKGIFASGGVLGFICVLLDVLYYMAVSVPMSETSSVSAIQADRRSSDDNTEVEAAHTLGDHESKS